MPVANTDSLPPPPTAKTPTTVEQWAAARGHVTLLANGQIDPRSKDLWKFRAAQAAGGWGEGRELSEADYDKAIAEIEKVEIR